VNRSIAWRIALAVVAVAASGEPARAEADGPDFYAVRGVAANDVLHIRAAPSASSTAIGEIPPDGRGLQNLGCQGGPTFAEWERMNPAEREHAARKRWCKIRYQGIEGWVAGWFLAEDSGPAPQE
jgi:hypothetical protein